jgi:hypothetical protein
MAVYRIYPEKDTIIWSETNTVNIYGNAGKDEILEIGTYKDVNQVSNIQRTLIQFDSSIINSTLNSKVTGEWSASLHLALAEAGELPQSYAIEAYPISNSWVMGTGKRDDQPLNTTGVTWKHRANQADLWSTLGGDYLNSPNSSQTKGINSNHDLDINVSSIVVAQTSSIQNNGILLKLEDSLETNTTSSINLKYFGSDTNTIFPPYLEIKWDDSTHVSTLENIEAPLSGSDLVNITIKNAKAKYADSDTVKFRLSTRPTHPKREFSTTSIYLREYKLPTNSYWGIKDEYSGEMIVNFSEYTKISSDNTSSFFNVYMRSFQPERFYRLLIKTTVNDSTLVVDNNNTFKVTRNG